MENLFDSIKEQYGSFSKGQKRIADFILANYGDAAFLTAARLGERAGVSESTVVRFAYEMGLDGYPALQEAMQEQVRHRLTSVQRIRLSESIPQDDILRRVMSDDINNIRASIEMIDNRSFSSAISAILGARRIYVIGVRSAAPLAEFLGFYLDYVCESVIFLNGAMNDIYERMLRLSTEDVVIGISFPRYSTRTREAMRFAKASGATVIALTDVPESPFTEHADIVLCARSNMAGFADSLVAPLSLINALILAVGLARRETAYEHLGRLEEIWKQEGVYVSDNAEAASGKEKR